VESLVREFQIYGSVQGSAVGSIQMKCLEDLDEAEKSAADAVQLKPIQTSPPSTAAVAAPVSHSVAAAAVPHGIAATVSHSINGSTAASFCKPFHFVLRIYSTLGLKKRTDFE